MRYHIDTIPVWDAAKLDCECLLCALKRHVELQQIEYSLGASVMEPDVRIQVNKKGFCRHHQRLLFSRDNRLGHALMLESHLTESRQRMDKAFKHIQQAASGAASASLIDRISGKAPSPAKAMENAISELEELEKTCIVCESIEDNMNRYLHTFFHLYQNDADFRRHFEQSKGLCLPHTVQLLRLAPEELPSRELAPFAKLLCRLETEAFDRIQDDVSWFIKKFDYRFHNEPWKESKDAVERSVNKLRGWCVGKEPNPDDEASRR